MRGGMRIIIHNSIDNLIMYDDGVILFSSARPGIEGSACWDIRSCGNHCLDTIIRTKPGDIINLPCGRPTDRYRVHHLGDTILLYNIEELHSDIIGLRQYREALDLIPVGVIRYHNASGDILMANRYAEEILGDSIRHKPISRYIPDIDQISDSLKSVQIRDRRAKCRGYPVSTGSDSAAVITQIEIHADESEEISILKTGIMGRILTSQQWTAYRCYLLGMSARESARYMGIEQSTYAGHLSEARKRILSEVPSVADLIEGILCQD